MRKCGQCTLCCKLVPVAELQKPAGQRCVHQRHAKGCSIYAKRPMTCMLWNCRWLVEDDTAGLARPDRSRYVIDIMPDYVTAVSETGQRQTVPVVQVWCDPATPDAWRDPALLAYIERRGAADGFGAIIRFDNRRATVVFPPSLTGQGWVENSAGIVDKEHSAADVAAALGPDYAIIDTSKALAGILPR